MTVNYRSLLRLGLRVAAVSALLFLVSELVFRFFGYGSFIIYRPDQELLWLPVPNQKGKTVVGRRPITINSSGLRYKSSLESQNQNEIRILAFGDSVTMGWGVDDDSHYCAKLESLLSEISHGRRIRVLSAGVNAYPTSLCVQRFRRLLRQGHHIDIAILAYSFNQSFDHLSRLEGPDRARFLNRVRIKSFVRRSAVYNLLIEDLLRQAVYYRVRHRLVAGSWDVRKDLDRDDTAEYVNALEIMKSEAERYDVALVFLLLGTKGQKVNRLNKYQQAFLQYAEAERIPVVNIVAHLESLNPEMLFMDHTHPSAAGHEVIARKLVPMLQRLPRLREANESANGKFHSSARVTPLRLSSMLDACHRNADATVDRRDGYEELICEGLDHLGN